MDAPKVPDGSHPQCLLLHLLLNTAVLHYPLGLNAPLSNQLLHQAALLSDPPFDDWSSWPASYPGSTQKDRLGAAETRPMLPANAPGRLNQSIKEGLGMATGVARGGEYVWEEENVVGGLKLGSPMASAARRQRRERRFRRYLSAGRLVRAQALLQRHPGLDVDAGQPPPLHRACARHDAPALCLLLRLGADPARQDRHGDTALHAAARQGPDAYTDFFLPLLSRCPSAMGIKNKDGETPGQILGWGPPWDSAEEDDDDEASREQEWRRKLQGELEDEWQEVIGRFEDDASHETQEPESFSAWSDRLAREHAQKRQRQQREAQGACRPQRAEGSSASWRQQEEEQRLFRERARVKEEELRASRVSRDPGPETARARPRAEHTRGVGRGSLWRFGDVPWPCPGGGDPEAMAAALVARGPPLEEQGALRRYLRVQQVRWHPDRFLQRFRNQIETWELGRVMGAVTALSQALNRHAEALK